MTANDRARARGAGRARRILAEIATEMRDARVRAGLSQEELGRRLGMSGDKVWKIEHERARSLSISDACEMAAVLGLDLSARLYPNGVAVRDAGQARRLMKVLENVGSPLTYRTDVPLPARNGLTELRAWDATIYGSEERTAIELESRLGDVQATTRRHGLKRRDDPVDHFLLVVADTRHNRRVLDEFASLLADLPRLRTANILAGLRRGRHPPTGLILI